MKQNVQGKFFGTILQYLRGFQVDGARLVGIGDREVLTRLFQLEDEHLQERVSEASVIIEVLRRTNDAMGKKYGVPPPTGAPQPLEQVVGTAELEQLVKEIADFLASIPYTSTFWAQLRGVKLAIDDPIAVGPFRLRVVSDQYKERPKSLLAIALIGDKPLPPDLKPEEVVLEMTVEGYSPQQIYDSSPTKALSLVKEFIVLAEAVEVLSKDGNITSPQATPLLCEVTSDDPPLAWLDDVPLNAARHVDAYRLSDEIRRRPRGLFDPQDDGNAYVEILEADRVKDVRARLMRLERVFAPEADKHVVSLRTAAQWYFDSLAENNETTAFLFVSLGLEALLGGTRRKERSRRWHRGMPASAAHK